ncbi:HEPACAM family member 2 [Xyrichtys novacula]|uniref:HEPACAM family member 2 n=1 Tax=Xyrichtys novacula TaxID=13765 RepID=A0AAV1FD81_XYRNO|nr:HEPACAM family member 2 [Xyrichtys novacula]
MRLNAEGMDAAFGLLLLLLLLGVSNGVEMSCDGRQSGAQCYAALGGTVLLRVMDDASKIFKYAWKKEPAVILNGRRDKIVTKPSDQRFSFTPKNGTFRINNLNMKDAGEYVLEMYVDSSGTNLMKLTLRLIIQAPVSSVHLVSGCLSHGEMGVSCYSKGGDSPQYSWTLGGYGLTDRQLLSGNSESQNITLKQDVTGQLACTVKNHISSVQEEETISTCGFKFFDCTLLNGTRISQWLLPTNETQCIEPTTEGKETDITVPNTPSYNITPSNHTGIFPSGGDPWYISYLPVMAGVLCALLILLAVGVGVVYVQRKKENKPKEDTDEQELTYADVRIAQRQGRQVQQRGEAEVEYGQVKFSQRPRQSAKTSGDECVYSNVRKGR